MREPTDFALHLHRFFTEHLTKNRKLSKNTVASYRDCFKLLLVFFKEKREVTPDKLTLSRIDSDTIIAYLDWLQDERKCSDSTRNSRLAALHSFFSYLQAKDPIEMIRYQRIMSIPIKKSQRPIIKHLTLEQVKNLLAQPDSRTRKGRRDLVLLSVLYDTASRVQEICDMRVRDICLEYPSQITITGKGNKTRITPIIGNTVTLLKAYIKENHMDNNSHLDHPLFFNQRKEALTRSGITHILNKYFIKLQDNTLVKISPHILRHSKAVHLLQSGVSLEVIREILGHVSIQTTEIYAKMDIDTKRKALEQAYNPDTLPQIEEDVNWWDNPDLMMFLGNL